MVVFFSSARYINSTLFVLSDRRTRIHLVATFWRAHIDVSLHIWEGENRSKVHRRGSTRRIARMSQLRYQAAYCLVALYLFVYRPDRWQRAASICNVNRNVGFGRLLHAILPSPAPPLFIDGTSVPFLPIPLLSPLPRWTPRSRSGVDPVHVQVVIKITCTRAMPFGDPRTLPEGLHGCKLDRHLHRVNCETALFANYGVLWTRRTRRLI